MKELLNVFIKEINKAMGDEETSVTINVPYGHPARGLMLEPCMSYFASRSYKVYFKYDGDDSQIKLDWSHFSRSSNTRMPYLPVENTSGW